MKFKIFGGLDCPDYLLAQVSVLSTLPVPMVSLFAEFCVSAFLARSKLQPVDDAPFYDEVLASELPSMAVAQSLTAMHSLITQISRFQVNADTAINELTMLGVSKEAAEAMLSAHQAHADALMAACVAHTPMLPGVSCCEASAWVATAVSAEGEAAEDATSTIFIKLAQRLRPCTVDDGRRDVVVEVDPDKAKALLAELVVARETLAANTA